MLKSNQLKTSRYLFFTQ